jgi:hypothetical protein
MKSTPYSTDWVRMGLSPEHGHNAFTAPRRPDALKPYKAPLKRGPKPKLTTVQLVTRGLETPQERALRNALRSHSPRFNVPIASAEDTAKTRAIAGRPLDARHQ